MSEKGFWTEYLKEIFVDGKKVSKILVEHNKNIGKILSLNKFYFILSLNDVPWSMKQYKYGFNHHIFRGCSGVHL